MGVNGILNVNKPAGCTSFSIIARLRRLTGIKRVGHAGTLDPLASGVLPVCLGQATRVIEYMLAGSKEYLCGIELGTTTDTYDAEGRIMERRDYNHIVRGDIERALTGFSGYIQQTPPPYSALKLNGKPYYELARSGQQVQPQVRSVHIYSIELLSFDPPFLNIRVRCARGTYIRSLAHDLGGQLGCGAHLRELVRTAYGPFNLADAVTPATLESVGTDDLVQYLYPPDYSLLDWPAVTLSDTQAQDATSGRDIALTLAVGLDNLYFRAYHPPDRFIAILKPVPATGLWHPEKVFL